MTKYQLLPPLSEDEYASLFDDIAAGGVKVPIDVDENGEILDGHHRQKICDELGIECPSRLVELPEAAKADYALTVNLTRRHLDRMQRRQLVANSLKLDYRLGDRVHARRCGVDHKTVASVRSDLITVGEIPQLNERTGSDGKTYNANKPQQPVADPPADPPSPPDAAKVPTAGVQGQPEQNHRESSFLGAPPASDSREPETGDGRDPEVPPQDDPSGSDAQRQQGSPGVSTPAAVPKREETEVEQKRREDREMRERLTLGFSEGLVAVAMRLDPDPIAWFEEVYLRGVYKLRDMPRVRDCFTPDGIRASADRLMKLADYLDETGTEL